MKPGPRGRGLGEIGTPEPQTPAPIAEPIPSADALHAADDTAEYLGDEMSDLEMIAEDPLSSEPSAAEQSQIGASVLAAIMPKLRGVRSVTIRIYGKDREAGPALQQLLRRRGLDVKLSAITQIVPPPISKLSVRYQGVDATVTLAPDLEG
jgi:hypothetical protein